MSTVSVIRIPIFPFGMVNAHLIRTERGCVLVDTGIPGSERKIGRVLLQNGLSFRDIKLIVVTHAHTDHAGSASSLRRLSGAPILAHEADVDFYTRRVPMTYCPTSWVGRLFLKTPLPHEAYEGFQPDILMKNTNGFGLADFGLDGFARHTAGHTPGSIAVELSSRDALVGDLLASGILIGGVTLTGRAIRPPFEDDPQRVSRELRRLLKDGAERFHMGHGAPLGAAEFARHAARLSQMRCSPQCAADQCRHDNA